MIFLKDKSAQVRVEIFNHLEPLDSVIPLGFFILQIMDVMNELLNDDNWNVREQTVKNFKLIFLKLDEKNRENPIFLQILKDKLQDRVS